MGKRRGRRVREVRNELREINPNSYYLYKVTIADDARCCGGAAIVVICACTIALSHLLNHLSFTTTPKRRHTRWHSSEPEEGLDVAHAGEDLVLEVLRQS